MIARIYILLSEQKQATVLCIWFATFGIWKCEYFCKKNFWGTKKKIVTERISQKHGLIKSSEPKKLSIWQCNSILLDFVIQCDSLSFNYASLNIFKYISVGFRVLPRQLLFVT